MCRTWSETLKIGFLVAGLNYDMQKSFFEMNVICIFWLVCPSYIDQKTVEDHVINQPW